MLVMGVDPGIERTGVSILESGTVRPKLIFSKLIKTKSTLSQSKRLNILYDELSEIVSQHNIDVASVERLFFAKNVKTAMVVSEARGTILLAIEKAGIEIAEYTPLQVKQAIVGYGRSDKKQIESLVRIILKDSEIPAQDDVIDSMAIAITHINSSKLILNIKNTK